MLGPTQTFRTLANSTTVAVPWQANVYHLDMAPSNRNILICTTERDAMFKSIDRGLNWIYLNDFSGPVAFNHSDPNKIILGSNPFRYSNDGGTIWSECTNGSITNDILISPNGNFAIAATNDGLFVSTDGGKNWLSKVSGIFHDVEMKPNSNTDFYAVKNDGTFFRTIDSGSNWSSSIITYNQSSSSGYLLSNTASNPNHIYIAQLRNDAKVDILKSTNNGLTFNRITTVPENFSNGFYDFIFQVSPTNSAIMYVGVTSLYQTRDSGVNWATIGGYTGYFDVHPDMQDLILLGNEVILATDGGISISSDNFTRSYLYTNINNGIYASDFWGFAQGFQQDIIGGGRYHNGNTTWRDTYGVGNFSYLGGGEAASGLTILAYPNAISYRDLGTGFYVTHNSLYDNTSSLIPWTLPLPNSDFQTHPILSGYGNRIADVITHPLYNNTIFSTSEASGSFSLLVSPNKGKIFQSMRNFGSKVWNIKITRANPKVIYVLTERTGLWKTSDGGSSWQEKNLFINFRNFKTTGYQMFLTNSQTDENTLWLTYSPEGLVFKSIDGGETWLNLTTATLNGYRTSAIEHQAGTNDGVYIFGERSGISKCYYRNNTHTDWQDFSINLPLQQTRVDWTKIGMAYMKDKLRVCRNQGVWQIDFFESYIKPVAQPTADGAVVCSSQNIQFMDYSILNTQGGATWQWSFSQTPSFMNGTSAGSQNPIVSFGATGNVTITLKVTDASGKTNTKTVTNMIKVISPSLVPLTQNVSTVTNGVINTFTAKYINFTSDVPLGTTVNLYGEHIEIINTNKTLGRVNACYTSVDSCSN